MDLEITTIPMPDDYEGRVVITLSEAHPTKFSSRAVLYVHGYVDYFFQDHFAKRMVVGGFGFYAVDLRKYGRSMLSGQHPNYCRDMSEYYADIDAAIEKIVADGNDDITLVGHSTGGLLCSLYCAFGQNRDKINRLVLNSPFLEFNAPRIVRSIVVPATAAFGRLFPYSHMRSLLSSVYFQSVHSSACGEWNFDTKYKPEKGFPLYFAWLGAIRRGHKAVKRGLDIRIPILLMCSAESYKGTSWNERAAHADSVLDVRDIKRYGIGLGDDVHAITFHGGLHDLLLSERSIREAVMERMIDFMCR